MSLSSFCVADESDYHTDYEEEIAESALSDMELYTHHSEHTEEELTADTVRGKNIQIYIFRFNIYIDLFV